MRSSILLFALLLLPVQAQAYEASVVFTGCNPAQQTAVREALARTDTSLTQLLARFDKNELGSYLKAWFGDNPPAKIRARYQSIRDMLDRPRTIMFSCEDPQCTHDVFGYAEAHATSLCPEFFASKMDTGYDSQAGTLIHEFSHSYANTSDHAYGTHKARILAQEDPLSARNNADSYQYFFEAVTGEGVPNGDAAWNLQNSCEWAYDNECDHPTIGTGSCKAGTDNFDCSNQLRRQSQRQQSTPKPDNAKD